MPLYAFYFHSMLLFITLSCQSLISVILKCEFQAHGKCLWFCGKMYSMHDSQCGLNIVFCDCDSNDDFNFESNFIVRPTFDAYKFPCNNHDYFGVNFFFCYIFAAICGWSISDLVNIQCEKQRRLDFQFLHKLFPSNIKLIKAIEFKIKALDSLKLHKQSKKSIFTINRFCHYHLVGSVIIECIQILKYKINQNTISFSHTLSLSI